MSSTRALSEMTLKRCKRRRKQRELREERKRQGKDYPPTCTLPNRKCTAKTVGEEQHRIQITTEEKLKVYHRLLPRLLKKLGRIPDPRNPKKTKHQMTVLMIYGALMFVFQMTSRRASNQDMTTPLLLKNLQAVFPDVEEMPHQDTLCRLLEDIDVDQIEQTYEGLIRQLIRKKVFRNLLHDKHYLVAIDGTQKYRMDEQWDSRYLRRKIKGQDGEYHYYAYVLEAVLVFSNGMVLPLMSQFLENSSDLEEIEDPEQWKQDCELKAFHRLAKRIKKAFPKLRLTLLLDGLYANGPLFEVCRKNKWGFMIVLKDQSLPSVWDEVRGLMALDKRGKHRHERIWKGRDQQFRWVNHIEYEYGTHTAKKQTLHVVLCEEHWESVDKGNVIVNETARYAWISSEPIDRGNVHERCNLTGRNRWLQENNILKEKHQGYQYEHIFSHNWNAMKGYHFLMHIARAMNEIALYTVSLEDHVKEFGVQKFIEKFCTAMTQRELDTERIHHLTMSSYQLRLVC